MSSTVLIVEDFHDLRKLVAFYLAARGYDVIEAASGKAAIETAVREKPNFILLDLRLPDMYGVEVAHTLHKLPGTERIPIIGWTADDCKTRQHKELMLHAGILECIQKPVMLKELDAVIDRRQNSSI